MTQLILSSPAAGDPLDASIGDPEPGPERLNALCDGVVSIALTVLALEIRLPEHADGPLRAVLATMMPSVMAFLLSFAVIGGFWLAHHRLTRCVQRTSRSFNLTNIGFMLTLVSLNFPTAALARYGDDDPWAVILYASVVGATGLMLVLMVSIAHSQGLIRPAVSVAQRRAAMAVVVWPTLVFLGSIPLAVLHPLAAMLAWTLAALGPLIRRLVTHSSLKKATPGQAGGGAGGAPTNPASATPRQ